MTPEQFKKLLKTKQRQINQAYNRTLPVKVGTEAVKFVRENFRQEGFVDSKLEKWKPAKRKSDPNQTQNTLIEHTAHCSQGVTTCTNL